MKSKIQNTESRNPFIKLGADVESNILEALDLESGIHYLTASKRTTSRAHTFTWHHILRKMSNIAQPCTLPKELLPHNIGKFKEHFIESKRELILLTAILKLQLPRLKQCGFPLKRRDDLKLMIRYCEQIIPSTMMCNFIEGNLFQFALAISLMGKKDDFLDLMKNHLPAFSRTFDDFTDIMGEVVSYFVSFFDTQP